MKRLRSLHSLSALTRIDNLTKKELYLIATLLADKYLIDEGEDEQLFNADFIELTGISKERFNRIEREFLNALNWNLFVSDNEFQEFFSLFKNQMNKSFDQSTMDESIKFYSNILQFFIQLFKHVIWATLFLFGASLSISILTQLNNFKSINMNYSQSLISDLSK